RAARGALRAGPCALLFLLFIKCFIFNFLLEEMGERISDLEKRVADLMTEAGVENSDEELGVKTLS
uniref:Uncharacterized protein n=1 Tax=Serinus canaria TaxID=9135 RepID=A0A8C9KU34_SERCA